MQSAHPSDFGDTSPTTEQMMSPLERDALPPGTLLGGCQIIEAISCDGHSFLYLASDGALQRQVLIKEHFPARLVTRQGVVVSLQPGADVQAGSDALEAFLREARLLARLDHPAIARVHRFWEEHRTAYTMMPFLPVQTLAATLQRLQGPASEAWLRALLGPLLGALQVLHEQDCFHLGLSPDTISLLPDARPLLLDLSSSNQVAGPGLSAHADSLDRLYVPIEQFSHGAGLGIGPWSDLYALAAVVHHAMLGRPPVSAAVLGPDDHLVTLAESLRARSDVSYSPSFVAAIDRALAVRPQDRPQDVTAFQRLLSQPDAKANPSVVSVSAMLPFLNDRPPVSSVVNAAPPPAAAATAAKAPPAATVPPKPEAAPPVSPLAQPPVDDAQVSPLAGAPADDAQAIDPAVTAAIALAISSLPWDTKYEPTLAHGASPAAGRTPAAGALDEPSLSPEEFTSTMPAGPGTRPAATPAPAPSRRWVAATAGVLLAAFGGWFALTRTEVPAQLAQWVRPGAASAARSGDAPADPAAATAATPAAAAASQGGLPDGPTATGPTAATESSSTAAANSVSVPLAAAAAVSEAAATASAAAASVPVTASASTAASSPVAAGVAAPAAASTDTKEDDETPSRATGQAGPAKSASAERNKPKERSVAAAVETEAAPASPRAACGSRTNFSLEYCMQTQCKQARFSRHPQCRALR